MKGEDEQRLQRQREYPSWLMLFSFFLPTSKKGDCRMQNGKVTDSQNNRRNDLATKKKILLLSSLSSYLNPERELLACPQGLRTVIPYQ